MNKRVAKTVLAFLAAYAAPMIWAATHATRRIDLALWRLDDDFSAAIFRMFVDVVSSGYGTALFFASMFTVLGALVRTVARARVRAGLADPLERVRAFLKGTLYRHALTMAPALLWGMVMTRLFFRWHGGESIFGALPGFAVPMVLVLIGQIRLARRGLAALVAPTLDASESGVANEEATAEGLEFDAVAVTRETRAAVGGVGAVSVAMTALAVTMPVSHMRDPAFLASVAAYIALASGAAYMFRRTSRVSVGLDGVHVRGSSRSRFFAFHELDGARANGGNIELVRNGRALAVLQLHGKDAARREALVKRLHAAITRANEERDQPVVSFVNSASKDDLARAAEGGGSYRRLAVSRDQLWAALEGPSVSAMARLAAADALANSTDPAERARFRIAAEQCAEPTVRVHMQELLEEDAPEEAPAARRILRSH